MAVLPIRLFGDPVLRTRADEVAEVDESIRTLVADMMETMDDAGGVGLAANQVGVLKRVFVFDCSHTRGGLRGHVINPVWEPVGEDTQAGEEGCLSVPEVYGDVTRYASVRLTGQDVAGNPVAITASGLLARCIQHETDHLDGVMFMKRMPPEGRKEAMREIRTAEWFTRGSR